MTIRCKGVIFSARVEISQHTSKSILSRVESANVGHTAAHYRENLPAICLLVWGRRRRGSTQGHANQYVVTAHDCLTHVSSNTLGPSTSIPREDFVASATTSVAVIRGAPVNVRVQQQAVRVEVRRLEGATNRFGDLIDSQFRRRQRYSDQLTPILGPEDGPTVVSLREWRRNGHGSDGVDSRSNEGCRLARPRSSVAARRSRVLGIRGSTGRVRPRPR